MSTIESVVITAAGLGSRLGLNMPKCLVEIEGRPLIHHQLDATRDLPDVRVVVGFREREVVSAVREVRDDVLFVRNPNYLHTSNVESLRLGSVALSKKFITLDGDVLINYSNFSHFLTNAAESGPLVGVVKKSTDEAVSVEIDEENNQILRFHLPARPQDLFEWSGIAAIQAIQSQSAGYVYTLLDRLLPVSYIELELYEIDTEEDLKRARETARRGYLDRERSCR